MKRSDLIVKAGRVYQDLSPLFSPVDKFIFKNLFEEKSQNKLKVICLLAPPRSGSTITYQLLRTYFNCIYLSNLWNLFYSTPFIGGKIAIKQSNNYGSTFNSNKGFVRGLNGEAEGLRFWKYWTGQGMTQGDNWKLKRSQYLKTVLENLANDEQCFVTGFLGHVFCVDELRKLFPNIIFVHLKRDTLSNAYSIYKASPKNWISTRPKFTNKFQSRYDEIIYQVNTINNIIEEQSEEDTIRVAYEDICNNPILELQRIKEFSEMLLGGISVNRDLISTIPHALKFSVINQTYNNDTLHLYHSLTK